MLRFKLKELTDKVAVYLYYPEWFTDCPGTVGLDLVSGNRIKLDPSSKDPHYYYGAKMWKRIEEFRDAGNFKESGVVAWC